MLCSEYLNQANSVFSARQSVNSTEVVRRSEPERFLAVLLLEHVDAFEGKTQYQGGVWRDERLFRNIRAVVTTAPLTFADHVEDAGVALFERACKLDPEGIVAKQKHGLTSPHASRAPGSRSGTLDTPNGKVEKNYSSVTGAASRPGWHACDVACALLEA